jgi:hypothetical protein
METAQQMHNFKAMPASHPQVTHQKSMGQTHGRTGEGGNSFLELNPQAYAQKVVGEETKANLAPYQARGAEITQLEGTAANRYKGYGEATDKLIGGLQQGAEGSAKTYANLAAENALKAQNATAQVGQNTAAANGNYLDPQVKAALALQGSQTGEIGAARQAGAEASGQSEANFLTSMRAAAAQRVTEGQQGIASTYGKQQAQNQQGISTLLGRVPGATAKLAGEVAQKQFTDRATEAGLGIKQGSLQVTQKNAATKEFSAKNTAETRAANQRIAEQKLGFERAKFGSDQEYKNAVLSYQKLGAENKQKYDEAAIRYKHWQESQPGGAKSASNSQTGKAAQQIFTAYGQAANLLGPKGKHGGYSKGKIDEVRQKLIGSGKESHSALIVSAALNLAVYGRLGPNDKARLKAEGVDPSAIG